jgi:hypothetical protein
MSASGSWQYAVLALIVLASLLQVLRMLAPRLAARVQAHASAALNRPGRPGALRRLGRWLQPRAATGNCSDGCGTCGRCGTGGTAPQPDAAPVQPIHFQARLRSSR